MSDPIIKIKQLVADQASEFYGKEISVYEFVFAQIDKSDFTVSQIFSDDLSASVLNVNYGHNYIFAYEIHPAAIKPEVKEFIKAMSIK